MPLSAAPPGHRRQHRSGLPVVVFRPTHLCVRVCLSCKNEASVSSVSQPASRMRRDLSGTWRRRLRTFPLQIMQQFFLFFFPDCKCFAPECSFCLLSLNSTFIPLTDLRAAFGARWEKQVQQKKKKKKKDVRYSLSGEFTGLKICVMMRLKEGICIFPSFLFFKSCSVKGILQPALQRCLGAAECCCSCVSPCASACLCVCVCLHPLD